MKSTRKMIGAMVCSVALSVGCAMPAFAAAGDVTAGEKQILPPGGGTSNSAIDVVYNPSNISVTVPIKMAIGVTGGQGQNIVAPTAGAYAIENTSDVATLYVKKIVATAKTDSGKDVWSLVTDDAVAGSYPTTNAPLKGQLALHLTDGVNPIDLSSVKDAANTVAINWSVTAGTSLPINITGKSSTPGSSTLEVNDTTTDAISLVYTISNVSD